MTSRAPPSLITTQDWRGGRHAALGHGTLPTRYVGGVRPPRPTPLWHIGQVWARGGLWYVVSCVPGASFLLFWTREVGSPTLQAQIRAMQCALRLAPCAFPTCLPACLPGNVAVASHVQVMTVVVLVAHGLITLNCTTRGSQQPRVVQFSSSTPCATLPITRNLHDVVCLTGPGRPRSYVDGVLVQSYVYGGSYPLPAKGVGRVGIGCVGGASAVAEGVKAWAMSLSS